MKAVGNFIVVDEVRESYKSQGGLLLSSQDTIGMKYREGKVVAVGDLVKGLEKDDIIYYNKVMSHEARIQGELYTIIQDRDVAVVL